MVSSATEICSLLVSAVPSRRMAKQPQVYKLQLEKPPLAPHTLPLAHGASLKSCSLFRTSNSGASNSKCSEVGDPKMFVTNSMVDSEMTSVINESSSSTNPQFIAQEVQVDAYQLEQVDEMRTAVPRFVSSSLYVGDLSPSVSEAFLQEMFSQAGEVLSVKICCHVDTGISLGYAYVNYSSVEAATYALESLNYAHVDGKPIRLMFSQLKNNNRPSEKANIFLKNLEASIDSIALHDTFSAFGVVLSCKVALDDSGHSKGFGFVQFEDEDSAQLAIRSVNGMLMNYKKVYVGPFVRRPQSTIAEPWILFTNVYVKNLGPDTDEEELKNVFGEFGAITSAVVMKDVEGNSRLFGFVNFEDPRCAAIAINALHGKTIRGRDWYVGRAQKKAEREADLKETFETEWKKLCQDYKEVKRLYVRNVNVTVDEQELLNIFGEFGTITSCKVLRHRSGKSKGIAFVLFSCFENASNAMIRMHGKMVRRKPLVVKFAYGNGPRKKQKLKMLWDQPGPSRKTAHPEVTASLSADGRFDPVVASSKPWDPQPWSTETLLSTLAMAAVPEERLAMLGGQLYPLVDRIEHEYAAEVTNVIVKMDSVRIVEVIEDHAALKLLVEDIMKLSLWNSSPSTFTPGLPPVQIQSPRSARRGTGFFDVTRNYANATISGPGGNEDRTQVMPASGCPL